MFARKQKRSILNLVVAIVLLGGLLGMKAVEQARTATTIVVENVNDSGASGAGAWINIDVTTYVTGNGTYNLALTTASGTAISFVSREAGANAPQLIVETTP